MMNHNLLALLDEHHPSINDQAEGQSISSLTHRRVLSTPSRVERPPDSTLHELIHHLVGEVASLCQEVATLRHASVQAVGSLPEHEELS